MSYFSKNNKTCFVKNVRTSFTQDVITITLNRDNIDNFLPQITCEQLSRLPATDIFHSMNPNLGTIKLMFDVRGSLLTTEG